MNEMPTRAPDALRQCCATTAGSETRQRGSGIADPAAMTRFLLGFLPEAKRDAE